MGSERKGRLNYENLFQFFWSSALIWIAARWLVRASDEIAQITGLSHLFVGSLFLAASTSAPELFVDIEATRRGIPNLAAGDLLGSSLVNLIIFCALSLLGWNRVRPELPRATRLAAGLAALLTLEVGLFIFFGARYSYFGVPGFILVATYLLGLRLIFKTSSAVHKKASRRLLKPVLSFVSGTILIFFASPFLVSSVEEIAKYTGLGNTFVGTTLLAFATSFPEMSSSITAIRKGLFPLAAGNIVGSNAFNMLIFVVMSTVWQEGSLWAHLSRKNLIAAAFVVLNMAIFAVPGTGGPGRIRIDDYFKIWLVLFLSIACYFILYFLR